MHKPSKWRTTQGREEDHLPQRHPRPAPVAARREAGGQGGARGSLPHDDDDDDEYYHYY